MTYYAIAALALVQLVTVLLAYRFGMAWLVRRDALKSLSDRIDTVVDNHYRLSVDADDALRKQRELVDERLERLDKQFDQIEQRETKHAARVFALERQLEEHAKSDHGGSAAADKHRAELDNVIKLLAEDWLKRFNGLEKDWQKLKEHQETQLAGTLAQVSSLNTRGFNR